MISTDTKRRIAREDLVRLLQMLYGSSNVTLKSEGYGLHASLEWLGIHISKDEAERSNAARYSLHRARIDRGCDFCGHEILPGESFWRAHAPRSAQVSRIICSSCHTLFGLPNCGWVTPPDGESCVIAHVPSGPAARWKERWSPGFPRGERSRGGPGPRIA